ncbi:MAG: MopE-related protein, partial [Myxococcota bacterium]|nr:MopE-related protein [Myxococcota bacterium]
DQDCDGADLTDVDGDGIDGGPYGEDCDDTNAERYPGATEDCEDGIDGDCDGVGDAYDDDCGAVGDDDDSAPDCSCDIESEPGPASPLVALGLLAALTLRRRR